MENAGRKRCVSKMWAAHKKSRDASNVSQVNLKKALIKSVELQIREKGKKLCVCMGDAEFVPQTNTGHFYSPDRLSGDV